MYQFSIQVQQHDNGFVHTLDELKQQLSSAPNDRILFHIYSTVFSEQTLNDLISALHSQFRGCQIVCATVSGAVIDHDYQAGIIISAKVFEHQDSKAQVRVYDLTDTTDKAVAAQITRFVQDHPWVEAIEIHHTVHDMNTTDLCATLTGLPEHISIFGGIVCSEEIGGTLSYIADQNSGLLTKGILAVYYGGSDLHIETYRMSGWKPIDKTFTVTKSDGNVIKEIDGEPPYQIYSHYLGIEPDDNFIMNALEFPLLCQNQNRLNVRNVLGLDSDGSFTVSSDVAVGTKVRICYADAASIAEEINSVTNEIAYFTPDVVSVVSCITRSIIWRMKDYMPELQGLKSIAPCQGYLGHGELLRRLTFSHHNTLLVAAAFREGPRREASLPEITVNSSSAIPLVARLSTFIGRVTGEMKDMYSEVEQVATTDALTQIGNRYRFDDAVKAASVDAAHADTKYLMMLDLNGLKFVNDTFGHNEGDKLIKTAAETLVSIFSPYGQCFRIGGDEFAVIADFENGTILHKALEDFSDRLNAYNSTAPYALSMAVGYAALVGAQGKPLSASDWKMAADINMYLDKTKFHAIKPLFLNRNMSEFISCIMSMADNKNPITAYHSIRVQRMSVIIAKLLQLDDTLINRVNLAAYLHDIGRIGISDLILTKTDALSDEDTRALRQKPIIGRRILSTSEETKHVADIVYACCEHWDGSGYPEGLSGGDIPLEARIVAIADFIDTSLHGGYGKAAISAGECIRELEARSGSAFDPEVIAMVVPNFVDIVKSDMTI